MSNVVYLLVMGAAIVVAPVALGNIRAPKSLCRPGGGALGASDTDPNVVVMGETLNVWCGKTHCTVIAEYDVRVAVASEGVYDFLAPFSETLDVDLNERSLKLTVAKLDEAQWQKTLKDLDGCQSLRDDERSKLPIRRGRFVVPWKPGNHNLSVAFVQQMGFEEHSHSYMSDGEIEKTFVYDLWPLRTWTLDPAFEIKVMVQSDDDAPSFLTALGGFVRVSCGDLGEIEDGAFDRPDRVRLIGTFKQDFPDRLVCQIQDNGVEPEYDRKQPW